MVTITYCYCLPNAAMITKCSCSTSLSLIKCNHANKHICFCRELSKELQVNVLGYDYSGYGCSTGTPSVSNAIADIHACYHYLLQRKGKRPEDIVAYGQSVGSGPSCNLAACEPQLKGLVLHSPLMSGRL